MQTISNWGNYPKVRATLTDFYETEPIAEFVRREKSVTIRGAGLSYGDASLSENLLSTTGFNRILHFDEKSGLITTEAGLTLDNLLKITVPKGWFLYVTPGTKFITVGGAIGGDVHGKNHHKEGAFCDYVTQLTILLADGSIKSCNRETEKDLFNIICGGVGLGALILNATFKLKRITTAYIRQQNIVINNLDQMLEKLQEFETATYSVSWIDCVARGNKMGRGILMLGEHLDEVNTRQPSRLDFHPEPKLNLPFNMPTWLLNKLTVGTFNSLFFAKNSVSRLSFDTHYNTFFYPLDFAKNWNRLYGKAGFIQYQFVLPYEHSKTGLRKILKLISESGNASFLAVLKTLGQGNNMLSFPMPGFTLALDFPVNKKVFELCETLDQLVIDHGGRIYLVKDARMRPEIYWKGYPNADNFKSFINQIDPQHKFTSLLAQRLKMI
jgi:decaprenylphospho-beta-D-ribofuranose 2-oxidase